MATENESSPLRTSDTRRCFSKTSISVYSSHFLSAWGDRMWSFGVGIFLIYLNPGSLQLTAIYGLCMGFSVLLFGAFIGDIVDNTPRLKAAQVALVFQNSFVVTSAILIYLYLEYKDEINGWGEWAKFVFYAITIILGVFSRLNSLARKLAVEKDWIVEICKGDTDALANMTATLRRIDLTTQVLAPMATGIIMGSTGVEIGALFIGGWNLVSVIVEYYLLWMVYTTVPALRAKKDFIKAKGINKKSKPKEGREMEDVVYAKVKADDDHDAKKEEEGQIHDASGIEVETSEKVKQTTPLRMNETSVDGGAEGLEDDGEEEAEPDKENTCCSKMLVTVERLYKGWPIYIKYPVAHAGIGLACLYMTVLGLDNVTVGYAKMQGVSELQLGLIQGIAAFFGIVGTLFYPLMRKRLGLVRTGIFGFSFLVMTLVPCVISVWMPGSPFDLTKGFEAGGSDKVVAKNCTDSISPPSSGAVVIPYNTSSTSVPAIKICAKQLEETRSQISIWMLLAGIVTARFGLWIGDLSITQLFLQEVREEERGKVNGVQTSLNQLMGLLKYLMVILLPFSHQFGLTVIISFSSICLGWCFYAYYLRKVRGHFLPHCKGQNGSIVQDNDTGNAELYNNNAAP